MMSVSALVVFVYIRFTYDPGGYCTVQPMREQILNQVLVTNH